LAPILDFLEVFFVFGLGAGGASGCVLEADSTGTTQSPPFAHNESELASEEVFSVEIISASFKDSDTLSVLVMMSGLLCPADTEASVLLRRPRAALIPEVGENCSCSLTLVSPKSFWVETSSSLFLPSSFTFFLVTCIGTNCCVVEAGDRDRDLDTPPPAGDDIWPG